MNSKILEALEALRERFIEYERENYSVSKDQLTAVIDALEAVEDQAKGLLELIGDLREAVGGVGGE